MTLREKLSGKRILPFLQGVNLHLPPGSAVFTAAPFNAPIHFILGLLLDELKAISS